MDIFDNLPSDPLVAFVELEQAFRTSCEQKLKSAPGMAAQSHIYAEYISDVFAAVLELGIEEELDLSGADVKGATNFEGYMAVRREVGHFVTRVRIRSSRQSGTHSAKLDANTKSKLRSMLEKIKETICELDVSDPKREALLKKTTALEEEINRDRTRWEIIGDLWIGLCDRTGASFEKLEPARKMINSIAHLLAEAKGAEPQMPALPRSETRKRLEPPKDAKISSDEDIPF